MPLPTIPEALKTADLARFINRAAQLESIRPVIAYWCEYWVIKHILAKGLHNADPETLEFTKVLMDKLEQIKAENSDNDAILDDVVGQAYVEQFALETFQRAENALRAKKASKQTAITFQAAATFLELVNIWTSPEADLKAKIKYAKWNAVRINRALNEVKDPNESNSCAEIDSHDNPPGLFTIETDARESGKPVTVQIAPIKALNKELTDQEIEVLPHKHLSSPQIPTTLICTEVPNEAKSKKVTRETLNETPLSPNSIAKRNNFSKYEHHTLNTSPDQPGLSNFQVIQLDIFSEMDLPQSSSIKLNPKSNLNLESFPSPCLSAANTTISEEINCDTPLQAYSYLPQMPAESQLTLIEEQADLPAANLQDLTLQCKSKVDDFSIGNAQKHARWAISALNFEDTDTAIKELREALKILHAD